MPLLVPGINTSLSEQSEWITKLVGKKLTESTTDANVSNHSACPPKQPRKEKSWMMDWLDNVMWWLASPSPWEIFRLSIAFSDAVMSRRWIISLIGMSSFSLCSLYTWVDLCYCRVIRFCLSTKLTSFSVLDSPSISMMMGGFGMLGMDELDNHR